MNNIVGVFHDRKNAKVVMEDLCSAGFDQGSLMLLTPESSGDTIRRLPSDDAEQPGMGKVIGGVAGGAAGLAGGAVAANFLFPGVGSILAVGLVAGAFGIGGAAAGGAAGNSLENLLTHGLPKDEIFLYEDALKQGRTLIIAFSDDEDLLESGRAAMERNGAESLDAARDQWWIGLRDAEQAEYDSPDQPFENDEQTYRRGFEAALAPECRGKSWQEAADVLRARYSTLCDQEPFRRGYARGQKYYAQRAEVENR